MSILSSENVQFKQELMVAWKTWQHIATHRPWCLIYNRVKCPFCFFKLSYVFNFDISGNMPTPANVGSSFSTTNDSVINDPTKSEGSELSSGEKVITKSEVSTIKRATSLKIKLNKDQQSRTGERKALFLEALTKYDAIIILPLNNSKFTPQCV